MTGFRELFEAYGGDYQITLGRFMGNEKMYLKFLNMLSRDENMQKLGDAVRRGDQTAAFEAAHTLKGVSANLGLTPLCSAVCAMVEPLRAGEQRDDYEELYEMVLSEYRRADELCLKLNQEAEGA